MVDAPRPLAPAVQTESERALSTLLANLPGVAYRCLNRPRWPMEFLSQGCLELTGYPPETFVMNAEMEYGDIIHAEDRKRIWGEVQLAIDTDRPFTLEYRIRTADGRQRRVWERGRAVRDVAGVLVSLEGFIWDVTERVELEARVLEAQRLEVMGQLAGGVVHDINNMLMVIRSFLDMAAAGHHGNSSKDWVGPAVHAVERGAALTRQLLTIARQEPHERREVELNGLLEGFVAMIGPLLGKLVTVDLHPADGPIRVYADPTQLEQVLMNLCINAVTPCPMEAGSPCAAGRSPPMTRR